MHVKIKKLQDKEESYPQKRGRYIDLHFSMLSRSNGAIMNNDILTHATLSLTNGYSVEETLMRSILFDIALQVESAGSNVFKIKSLQKNSMKTLDFLANWRNENKISKQAWSKGVQNFCNICLLKYGQKETLTAVLHRLRNPTLVG